MTATMFLAKIDHCRVEPKLNRFRYRGLNALVNLCDLTNESAQRAGFYYNQRGFFSLWDNDYLPGKSGSIKERLFSYIKENGGDTNWSRIELLTCPRVLGYVFNPVNFYLCYRPNKSKPNLLVAEVNNTFGETHLYLATPDQKNCDRRVMRFTSKKQFHVSPFYDQKGDYEFLVNREENMVDIRVNLIKNEKTTFTSGIKGNLKRPLTGNAMLRYASGIIFGWMTLPKILLQAIILRFNKGLKVFSKPAPANEWTIGKGSPTLIQRLALKVIITSFNKLQRGQLKLITPTGEELEFGDPNAPVATLIVHDWRFFSRVLFGGDIAFGECYVDEFCDSPDIAQVVAVFANNADYFDDRQIVFSRILRFANAIRHRLNANSKIGSKQNIAAHYDIGNNLFREFLDDQLVYSCAVFKNPEDSLEIAQQYKLRMMIDKAKIRPEHHLLEIGSGWGAFAVQVAKEIGCKVTTITLSQEQCAYTKKRVLDEGLTEKIEVKLCDYRDIEGTFDRIVSIEMLEAVGHEHLGKFFSKCDQLLKPNGIMALQCITIADQKYDAYRKNCDWIQKYIFPGGLCPSLTSVSNALTNHSELIMENLENIGPCYARTLKEWRIRFGQSSKELLSIGYDKRFQRMWNYYLSYCEAGFAVRTLGTLQLVITKPNNTDLQSCPGYEFYSSNKEIG